MKRFIIILVAVTMCLGFASCSGGAPKLDEVNDTFRSLIENSFEINDIFFGEGLPVYARGSDYAKENMLYDYLDSSLDDYEFVSEESKYRTVDEIKAASEKVYSKEYLLSIYETTFVGYADENAGILPARYYETDDWLYKSTEFEPLITEKREYDFSTMKFIKPSKSDYVNITVESSLGGKKTIVTLSFTKQEGEWRLDSPTY